MDHKGSDPEQPVPDQGSRRTGNVRDFEIDAHHRSRWQHQAMNVGLRLPKHRKRRNHHRRHRGDKGIQEEEEPTAPPTPPAERVKFILGRENEMDDGEHRCHDVFCELHELRPSGDAGLLEWKEIARWVKFEEDVEEGGDRWSKPHVATLSLHSLFELRKGIVLGTVMLDCKVGKLEEIFDMMMDNMVNSRHLGENEREQLHDILMAKHHHQHDKHMHRMKSLHEIGKSFSSKHLVDSHANGLHHRASTKDLIMNHIPGMKRDQSGSHVAAHLMDAGASMVHSDSAVFKFNEHFMKKLPPGCEAASVLVGEVDFLSQPVMGFIRLTNSIVFGELTEVPVPTRYIFIMVGPHQESQQYHEIGRCLSTLMSDEVFGHVAYKSRSREDLLAGIDEFLDQVTVLPPGEWDPSIRIEPPKALPKVASRAALSHAPSGISDLLAEGKKAEEAKEKVVEEEEEGHEGHGDDKTLERTGRLFGGLIQDLKRKVPFYPSDIKDAFHLQCISSFIFVYFACLSPIVTFGGLLGSATHNNMAAMESLLAGAVCGISYHIFAGQPLTILGSTGPVLVFETIVYNFAEDQNFDYLGFRFWIGIWCAVILLIIVAFDLSALVKYITRFTEESFALLIALIYIYEAFKKLIGILHKYPIANFEGMREYNGTCFCSEGNSTMYKLDMENRTAPDSFYNLTEYECPEHYGELVGPGCHHYQPHPDVFFFSCILFLFTFMIAYFGKMFKETRFLPAKIRSVISDFAVTIAIFTMLLVDWLVGLPTPKLEVPSEFAPTSDKRGWLVPPFRNPWWTIPMAIGFALLATILIFMDQQITAVIVNRKEHKLKKGCGYHLDLLVIAVQIAVCSIFGLPWFVAATVLSINHVRSLSVESETSAPGERPKFLGIREQRVTGIAVFLFVGLSVLFTPVLRLIPMPVLYGVFLYMGVASINGIQLCQRFACMFMPPKYQPDYVFLRNVPLPKVYLFTIIQVICLAILWAVKSIKQVAIIFPIMVLAMCFVRKGLECVFTNHDLKWLDDILPEHRRREKEDKKKEKEQKENGKSDKHNHKKNKKGMDNVAMVMEEAIIVDEHDEDDMKHRKFWKQLVAHDEYERNVQKEIELRQRKSAAQKQGDLNVSFNIEPPKPRFSLGSEEDEAKTKDINFINQTRNDSVPNGGALDDQNDKSNVSRV